MLCYVYSIKAVLLLHFLRNVFVSFLKNKVIDIFQ